MIMIDKVENIANNLGWNVCIDDNNGELSFEFSKYTPA